jgi:type II restriction/modification system DNA methylase subunit YeeA
MLEVGNIVKSKYTIRGHNTNIGLVMQLRDGAFENQPLAQVYWPHSRTFGWVEAKDMEVVSANT